MASDACGGCPSCPPARPAAEGHAHPWLDRLFLHPRWGWAGCLAVFAAVLFMVFEVSAWIDSVTTAPLAQQLSRWQPVSLAEILAKGVVDGLVGLLGIVLPYMIPLVALLVALEQSGVMPRIALVIDRAFHRIGVHGGVSVAFLTGLGCNVPAMSAAARYAGGRERWIASFLVTFVPCSARSAIVLALAGKYLGAWGVLAIFTATAAVIALLGMAMSGKRRVIDIRKPHAVPGYALPRPGPLLAETWARNRDILTIVTPLLVLGSVLLALLAYAGIDRLLDAALSPVTSWWLGLPVALGVPLVFGVLRKELSLAMMFQALGTQDVGSVLDAVQIATLVLFVTFYLPCISTFAAMLATLGRRAALQSCGLSIAVALAIAGAARWTLGALSG